MLILRDVVSSKTHSVPAAGGVIGREGGDADITVLDAKVSKRHARLYFDSGAWWLEDLQSANGSYIEKQRISEPVEVGQGSTFRLAAHDFHVMQITSDRPRDPDARGAATLGELPAFPEMETDGAAREIPNVRRFSSQPGEAPNPQEGDPNEMSDEATPQAMLGPALAYHVATVPLLALNPAGTVRRSIEDQRFPPLEKLPLVGLAAPGLAILLAVGVVFQVILAIVSLIAGAGFSAIGHLLVGIVIAIVGAAVGGLILGFAYHPVFGFILEKVCKGHSTMKSRTNFLAIGQSVGILSAVPNGLAVLAVGLAALLAPHSPRTAALLPIVPSFIQLGCTLIAALVAYRWFQYFEVHKIVPMLILIGGALAVLATVFGLVGSLRVAIAGGPASAPASATPARTVAPVVPVVPGGAAAHALAGAPPEPAAPREPPKAAATPSEKTPEKPTAKSAAAPENKGAASPKPEPTEIKPEALPPLPAVPALPPPAEPAAPVVRLSAYQRYAQKRDAVEHAITDDPLILRRDPVVAKGYKAFRVAIGKARKQEASKAGGDEVLLRHLIDADAFGTEARRIDELYSRLHLSAPAPVP